MKRSMRVLAGSLLVALSPLAAAQTPGDPIDTQVTKLDTTAANRGQTQVAGKIASNFGNLAGSDKNSLALVNALRNGTDATLTYKTPATTPGGTPTTTTTTYDPPTGKMGWGNVKISLALAQDSLARAGITNPTAEQLQAALNGGSVTVKNPDGTTTTTTLKGVLQMRADGMGWGEIAKVNGTKVGPVVSQLKMANTKVAALPPTSGSGPTTTAAGTTSATVTKSKGITTGAGASSVASGGKDKGITTAAGGSVTQSSKGNGNAYGRGLVTGAGGGATNIAATGGGKPSSIGAGVVTGNGAGASGVTTAQGNGGGNGNGKGNAGGNGNGKGKGG
jgi:hypothetical protein